MKMINENRCRCLHLLSFVNLRLALFLLFFLLSITSTATSTCLVAIRTKNKIFIGADSKMTSFANGKKFSSVTCKIQKAGNQYFATAGFVSQTPNYDADKLIKTVCRGNENCSLYERIARFDKIIKKELPTALEQFEKGDPVEFKKTGGVGIDNGLLVWLIGFEKGIPIFVSSDYRPELTRNNKIKIKVYRMSCPGDCTRGDKVYTFGEKINEFTKKHPNWEVSRSEEGNIHFLIQMEIDSGNRMVGPPIDILELNKEGATWLQKGSCQ